MEWRLAGPGSADLVDYYRHYPYIDPSVQQGFWPRIHMTADLVGTIHSRAAVVVELTAACSNEYHVDCERSGPSDPAALLVVRPGAERAAFDITYKPCDCPCHIPQSSSETVA